MGPSKIGAASRAFGLSVIVAWAFGLSVDGWGGSFRTNSLEVRDAPAWATQVRIERTTDAVERLLEWHIRRVPVRFYWDNATFRRENKLGSEAVDAFTRGAGADLTVHLGPRVTEANLHGILAHELTHVVVRQKHKAAVPPWLEEGLANFISQKVANVTGGKGRGVVDYAWLAEQPTEPITALAHPFGKDKVRSAQRLRYRYAASTALAEMIAAKCDIFDLLQLSLGRRMEPYLKNTCAIDDLDGALKTWISGKAKSATGQKRQ